MHRRSTSGNHSGSRSKGSSTGNRYSKPHRAHLSIEDQVDVEPEQAAGSSSGECSDEDTAYLCRSCGPNEEIIDLEDAMEQDVVCAFVPCCDLNDKEVCEDIADAVHYELVVFNVREQALERGVSTQRTVHSFRPPQSELTLDQRRQKVALANPIFYLQTLRRKRALGRR